MMAHPLNKQSAKCNNIIQRKHIKDLVAAGSLIFIFEGKVIKADTWAPWHPGGFLVLQHMVGRDATDEITALHSTEAIRKMKSYQIGCIDGPWENLPSQTLLKHLPTYLPKDCAGLHHETIQSRCTFSRSSSTDFCLIGTEELDSTTRLSIGKTLSKPSTVLPDILQDGQHFLNDTTQQQLDVDLDKYPSLNRTTQQNIVERYRTLRETINAEGLFQCNYQNYLWEALRYAILFGLFGVSLRHDYFALSGIFLGLFWHQLVFSAHDAGHMGITHNYQADTTIGILIADFAGGLSMGWWKQSHNVHHILTNSTEHDPDIQLLPFFAVSHRFFESLFSTYHDRTIWFDSFSRMMIPYQHYLYYPVLSLGRFNLYIQSWLYLLTTNGPRKGPARWHRTLEFAGQLFFWYWFGYLVLYKSLPTTWDRLVFVMTSHLATAPLHVQITMSHYGMSTADLGVSECFPQRMLRTTMDVDCPQWMDFVHGGLQFQAVHHLFPRIPRHNLRRTQKLVQRFCEEIGIPYALLGFVDGNKQVIGRLAEVARHATILAQCHEAAAKSCTLSGL